MKDLLVGEFKPEDDDDDGKQGAIASNEGGDMMTKVFLILTFLVVLGALYTQVS